MVDLFRYVPRQLDGILRPVDHALRVSCYPAVLLAQSLAMRLTCLEGPVRAGAARVLVAGPEPWASDLTLHLFSSPPERSVIRTVPLWRLGSTLEKMERDFDLVCARVHQLAADRFFPPAYLRVPEIVDAWRALPDNAGQLLRASESLTRDIRVVRQNGLHTAMSQDLDDFEEFYRVMYVPFIRARHGAMARVRNEVSLRNCFRRGGMVWLLRGEERLGGLVYEFTGDVLGTRAYATRDGYAGLTKKGVATALYYHAIRHAIERGCRYLDLGGCRPSLTDGLLLYKRKWGLRVRIRPHDQFYNLVRWSAWNPAVAAFLSDVAPLYRNGSRLSAITAIPPDENVTQAGVDRLHRALYAPGLDEFVMVNPCGWDAGIVPPPSTVLMDGSPLPHQLAGR